MPRKTDFISPEIFEIFLSISVTLFNRRSLTAARLTSHEERWSPRRDLRGDTRPRVDIELQRATVTLVKGFRLSLGPRSLKMALTPSSKVKLTVTPKGSGVRTEKTLKF